MAKNIALFVDGTGNDGPRDERNNGTDTNVHKLFLACDEGAKDYQEGVANEPYDVLGGLIGFGSKDKLQHAYNFLIRNYEDKDNIFLFGFSRGALAVRVLAGFLGNVGTIFGRPPFDVYLPYFYQLYESAVILDVGGRWREELGQFGIRPEALPIHFIGVWDTVEQVHPKHLYPEIETLAHHISHARHAVAIHERRREMIPTFWKHWGDEQTVKQTWFPGAHADVGGGYVERSISDESLQWMRNEAVEFGLKVKKVGGFVLKDVLHQQKTKVPIIQRIPNWLEHEEVRQELKPTNKKLMGSMHMSKIARRYLGGTDRFEVQFENYPTGEHKEAREQMELADAQALALLNMINARDGIE